jgi:hypothetical protein
MPAALLLRGGFVTDSKKGRKRRSPGCGRRKGGRDQPNSRTRRRRKQLPRRKCGEAPTFPRPSMSRTTGALCPSCCTRRRDCSARWRSRDVLAAGTFDRTLGPPRTALWPSPVGPDRGRRWPGCSGHERCPRDLMARPCAHWQCLLLQRPGPFQLAQFATYAGTAVQGLGDVGMACRQGFTVQDQRLFEQVSGSIPLAQVVIVVGQVAQGMGDAGVARRQRFAIQGQSLFVQLPRPLRLAQVVVGIGQVAQA